MKAVIKALLIIVGLSGIAGHQSASAQITIAPDTYYHSDPKIVRIKEALRETFGVMSDIPMSSRTGWSNSDVTDAALEMFILEVGGTPSVRNSIHIEMRWLGHTKNRDEIRESGINEGKLKVSLTDYRSGSRQLLSTFTTIVQCSTKIHGIGGVCEPNEDEVRELMYRLFDRLLR